MVVEAAGLAPQSRVKAIDAKTGQVTLSPARTGTLAAGARITFRSYYVAEALNVTNSTFNAVHRDIINSWGSFVQISNSSFLRFDMGAPDWAAIDLEETNNNTIAGNSILGRFKGVENGIIVSSIGSQGGTPSTVFGNVVNGVTGAGILLGGSGASLAGGTVSNTVVTGNTVYAAAAAVRSSLRDASGISANRLNDQPGEPQAAARPGRRPGPPPSVAGCGAGATVTGSDQGGEIAVGRGTVTGCALVFGAPWASPPYCAANTDNTAVSVATAARGARDYAFSFSSSLAGGHLDYVCQE
jgi:hypothetical protein